uniref:ShKT domain-containing protein n=1 Tax=Rhabditophanes sp. KR3021 TaxID=114890 RepID=A0AC35UGU4_9BILA
MGDHCIGQTCLRLCDPESRLFDSNGCNEREKCLLKSDNADENVPRHLCVSIACEKDDQCALEEECDLDTSKCRKRLKCLSNSDCKGTNQVCDTLYNLCLIKDNSINAYYTSPLCLSQNDCPLSMNCNKRTRRCKNKYDLEFENITTNISNMLKNFQIVPSPKNAKKIKKLILTNNADKTKLANNIFVHTKKECRDQINMNCSRKKHLCFKKEYSAFLRVHCPKTCMYTSC